MPAVALESAALRLVVLPQLGAKIASIFDRRTGFEWLIGPGPRPVRPVPYGAVFIEQDMSGWDEMFPTIKACRYPAPGAYFARDLPDHGEIWALPWEHEAGSPEEVSLTVAGCALPYQFWRTIAFEDESTVILSYQVGNTGSTPLECLWASHPQFSVTPDTRLLLPPAVREIVNVRLGTRLGSFGERFPWPEATDIYGKLIRLDRVGAAANHDCRKFYVPPELAIEWATLHQRDTGRWLRMEWEAEPIPYVGIWVDEGAVNPEPTLAIEISNGYHDSLETAWQNQRLLGIAPGAEASWRIVLHIGNIEDGSPVQE